MRANAGAAPLCACCLRRHWSRQGQRASPGWRYARRCGYVCKTQGPLPFELCMFTAMFARFRGSSPWGLVQLCLQKAGATPLRALYVIVYSDACRKQGQLPLVRGMFTAMFARKKQKKKGLELGMFTATFAKCRGSSPWSFS